MTIRYAEHHGLFQLTYSVFRECFAYVAALPDFAMG